MEKGLMCNRCVSHDSGTPQHTAATGHGIFCVPVIKDAGQRLAGSWHKKSGHNTRAWWLRPVIPATQKAEIRRITVQSQSQANSSQDPISKNPSQKRAGGVAQDEDPEFKPQYCKKKK
jgi:hypothetical protein